MSVLAHCALLLATACSAHAGHASLARQTSQAGNCQAVPERPAIKFFRWQEDWSVLANPCVPREPGDALKYMPLSSTDPRKYVSLGATLRERFVDSDPVLFGVAGGHRQAYLLQRLGVHADMHLTDATRVFVQVGSALAPGLSNPSSAAANRLDLWLAFLDTHANVGGGVFKFRIGRQEMAFDLQRFVAVRDGANVRQAFDAVWGDYEHGPWRITGFVSQPVQYHNASDFDDFSNPRLTFDGIRAQRKSAIGKLSVSYSVYRRDDAHFLAASGTEERRNLDIHDVGHAAGFDWDIEGMRQSGSVGRKTVDAWAFGALAGYTFTSARWQPRIGLQVDAASGNKNPDGNHMGTFNPLFPNGYYLTLSGYTGYTNFIHFKPSLTLAPTKGVKLVAALGMLWRETTHDAIYTMPDIPVPGTAGQPGRRSSTYGQLMLNWTATRSLSFAAEFDRYVVASALRRAGGHDSNYLGVEVNWGW